MCRARTDARIDRAKTRELRAKVSEFLAAWDEGLATGCGYARVLPAIEALR